MLQKGVVYFINGSSVRDLELVVSFFFNLIDMAADSGADTGRYLGGRNIYQIVTDTGTFTGGYSDACKWHEEPVSTYHLKKLRFVNIFWIDAVIINDRTKPWTGECNLCMRVFALQKIGMISGGKCILAEVIQTKKSSESDSSHATL